MKTSIWGPSAWRFLHAVTFSYPDVPSEEHKEAAIALFRSLRLLLPCGDCCSHYCKEFTSESISLAAESKQSLTKWLFEFHNRVNARLGKAEYSWDVLVNEFPSEDTCITDSPCGEDVVADPQNANVLYNANASTNGSVVKSQQQPCECGMSWGSTVITALALVIVLSFLYLKSH